MAVDHKLVPHQSKWIKRWAKLMHIDLADVGF